MSDIETHNERLKASLDAASSAANEGDLENCATDLAEADQHLEALYEEAGGGLSRDPLTEEEYEERISYDGELDEQSAHMMVERAHEKRQELLQKIGRLELL